MDISKINFEPILEKARQSDEGFTELAKTIESYVMYSAKSKLSSNEDIKDILQNVLLNLYRNIGNIKAPTFVSYLKTMVINECHNELRKRPKDIEGEYTSFVELDNYSDWEIPDEGDSFGFDEEYRKLVIDEVLDKLPDKQREIISLKVIDGLKFREISELLDTRESTLKSRYNVACENAKNEILKIQKRDDIKIHSYSPLAFFLLLLRKGYEDPTDAFLTDQALRTVLGDAAKNTTKTVVEEVGKTAVEESVKKATGAIASKAAAGGLSKAIIATAVVGALGIGGVVAYNVNQTKKTEELLEKYQNDKVKIVINVDDKDLYIGEKTKFNVTYNSSDNLEYILDYSVENPTDSVVVYEDDTIEAVKPGTANVVAVVTIPQNEKVKARTGTTITTMSPDNLTNKMGRQMLKHGYHIRHTMIIDYNKRTNQFEFRRTANEFDFNNFPWDDYNIKYSDWANEPCLDGKTGEEEVGTKRIFGDTYYYHYVTKINNDGTISETPSYNFKYLDDNTIVAEPTFAAESTTFIFEESTGEYYYDSPCGKVYLDFSHPSFVGGYHLINSNDKFVYDDNCRLLEETRFGTQRYVYTYKDDKIVESNQYINGRLHATSYYYYNDQGLLLGEVSINHSVDNLVSIIAYDYN